MTSHLHPCEDKACMNVQYVYACFYLVHTLVARRQDKERSRLCVGGLRKRLEDQGTDILKTWKNK